MNKTYKSSNIIKRTFDLGLSSLFLIGLSPLFVVTAIAIIISSKGPAIYRQERLGRERKPFMMYKFRTMVKDAEKDGPQLAVAGDTRVTRTGKLLRKFHIDELPQFWNVMKGDMSVIGPRPERGIYAKEIEKVLPEYARIYNVKPGITSLGMVKHGYASDIDNLVKRAKFDIEYLDKKNITLDSKILACTIKTIIQGKGV